MPKVMRRTQRWKAAPGRGKRAILKSIYVSIQGTDKYNYRRKRARVVVGKKYYRKSCLERVQRMRRTKRNDHSLCTTLLSTPTGATKITQGHRERRKGPPESTITPHRNPPPLAVHRRHQSTVRNLQETHCNAGADSRTTQSIEAKQAGLARHKQLTGCSANTAKTLPYSR